MSRTLLARLALTCAGLMLLTQAHAQTPPPAGGDTVNPWKGSGDAPKDGAGDTVNPWNGATSTPAGTPAPAADKATPAAKAAAQAARKPPARWRGRAVKAPSFDGPIASSPSFRMLEGGVTRIFIEVSRKVEVSENKAKGRVVYRLKGAHAPTRTNRLPLLTGFFVTPVDRVELVEQGDGIDLVIDLREALEPRYEVIESPRGIVLQVDFPRGAATPDPRAGAASGDGSPAAVRSTATKRLDAKGSSTRGDTSD